MPMDDKRLTEVFRAAVPDESVPPASFDHADVVRVSRRVTARRRAAFAGGGLAVLAVVGVGVAVLPSSTGDGGSPAAPAAAPQAPPAAVPPAAAPQSADGAPGVASEDARAAAAPPAPPLGPGTGECADRQDPALRELVEQALPEVAGATEAAVTRECRPGGERGLALHVDDAGVVGLLTVDYLPPGSAPRPPDPDTASTTVSTASGGTVTVTVRSDEPGALPPFAPRVEEVAGFLAPRL
jgi:hypothetical protein